MLRLGIIEMLKLALTFTLAAPIGMFGLQELLAGRVWIGGFGVAVAIGLLLVEHFLWTPDDIPAEIAQRATKAVVGDVDDNDDEV